MKEIRLLRADEIEARIGFVKEDYVSLLLYKDARCDMALLDEVYGPTNWQCHYSRDNINCTISIWDKEKQMWIDKEDAGQAEKDDKYYDKSLASDSFKRAAVKVGIGRELYTAPTIKVPANMLKTHFESKEKDRYGRPVWVCIDKFKVTDIEYKDRNITSVTILNTANGNELVYDELGRAKVKKRDNSSKETKEKKDQENPKVIRSEIITNKKAKETKETEEAVEDSLPFEKKK